MTQSRAPLIVAIALLLLPVLYVGSYLALVIPGSVCVLPNGTEIREGQISEWDSYNFTYKTYRTGGRRVELFFWPIEQVDRRLRPGSWQGPFIWSQD
jgi:hypothetical protein